MIGLVIGATTDFALAMVLIPIYFFFFAWQFDRIDQIIRFFPASKRERILHILHRMDQAVSGFFSGRFLIGLLTAGMYAGGWAFVEPIYGNERDHGIDRRIHRRGCRGILWPATLYSDRRLYQDSHTRVGLASARAVGREELARIVHRASTQL